MQLPEVLLTMITMNFNMMKVVRGFTLKVNIVSVMEGSVLSKILICMLTWPLWIQQTLNKVVHRALPWPWIMAIKFNQSEKTRKRKNTDNIQSSLTNVKKSRSWAVYNKNLSKEEVDKALIMTANSISEQLKRGNQLGDWGEKEVMTKIACFFTVLSPGLRGYLVVRNEC